MSNPRKLLSQSMNIDIPKAKGRDKKEIQVKTYSEFEGMIGSPDQRYFRLSASLPNDSLLANKKKAVQPEEDSECGMDSSNCSL